MSIYVDHTHVWRRVTGLERITLQLFDQEALAPLDVVPVRAGRTAGMMLQQTVGLPARLALSPSSVLVCPGFPPSPLLGAFRGRVIPYIHDVFLLSRRDDLNWRAKAYMAWPFERAVKRSARLLVNSSDTATKLARYARDDAEVTLYRPPAHNNFGLHIGDRVARAARPAGLRLAAVGTVEPRKNLLAAAMIVNALRERGFPHSSLDVIGRRGWGEHWEQLSLTTSVVLHGYLPDEQVSQVLENVDALICTSHEEGLGLPLLEAQFAGLPVIAPDQPVFREVLGQSGVYIDPANPRSAAETIAAAVSQEGWRAAFVERGTRNLARWNALAESDRSRVVDMLGRIGGRSEASAPYAEAAN